MERKSYQQITDTVLMIEPIQFGFNEEASKTNSFQQNLVDDLSFSIQSRALSEFKLFVEKLKRIGVDVIVHKDTLTDYTPDSIFPNNWFSTHESGDLFLYPMVVSNRRKERKETIISSLESDFGFERVDLSSWENESPPRYLEGTGSMIFDRSNRICYAARSPRTNELALIEFSKRANFDLVVFDAVGKDGEAIYHTNVMLCIGETFVCVGMDTISEADRKRVCESFLSSEKEIIEFSNEQIFDHFAGNMLQLRNKNGETILVLSERIYRHLSVNQRERLAFHNNHLLPIDIQVIEAIGGGGVRCMLAEIFKPT